MSSTGRRRSDNPRRTRSGASRPVDDALGAMPLSEARTENPSPIMNALTFAGYMTGMWLILQTVNSLSIEPAFGFVWSPALLGIVVGITTAIVKDERGVRSRLGITDFSSRRASLVWGGLGVVAIFAIMTLPR